MRTSTMFTLLSGLLGLSTTSFGKNCEVFDQMPYPEKIEFVRNQTTGPVRVELNFKQLEEVECRSWQYFGSSRTKEFEAEAKVPATARFFDLSGKLLLEKPLDELSFTYTLDRDTNKLTDKATYLLDFRQIVGITRLRIDVPLSFTGGKVTIQDASGGIWVREQGSFTAQ